jgi:hypothetical protein
MLVLRLLVIASVALLVAVIFVPKIRSELSKMLGLQKEGFSGVPDAGFNRRTVNEGRMILEKVGKEPLPRQPTYLDDPKMGNARRDLSRLPSIENGGFSLPDSYYFYTPPNYQDGFELPVMNAPRASESYHAPRSDAFHLYYQTLHNTLDYGYAS